jgi:hypothetical protein
MLGMTTPIVTELPLRLEPVAVDPFADDRVMNFVECDLPAELTLPQWRRARVAAAPRRRTLFAPIRRRAALAA